MKPHYKQIQNPVNNLFYKIDINSGRIVKTSLKQFPNITLIERIGMKKIYDIDIDEFREVTDTDIDNLQNCVAAFGYTRDQMRVLNQWALSIAQGKVNINSAPKLPEPFAEISNK